MGQAHVFSGAACARGVVPHRYNNNITFSCKVSAAATACAPPLCTTQAPPAAISSNTCRHPPPPPETRSQPALTVKGQLRRFFHVAQQVEGPAAVHVVVGVPLQPAGWRRRRRVCALAVAAACCRSVDAMSVCNPTTQRAHTPEGHAVGEGEAGAPAVLRPALLIPAGSGRQGAPQTTHQQQHLSLPSWCLLLSQDPPAVGPLLALQAVMFNVIYCFQHEHAVEGWERKGGAG